MESYRYLGFVLHATKAMTFGPTFLVAAARKAMFVMRRRCAFLGIKDPAMQCKLLGILVLPIPVIGQNQLCQFHRHFNPVQALSEGYS